MRSAIKTVELGAVREGWGHCFRRVIRGGLSYEAAFEIRLSWQKRSQRAFQKDASAITKVLRWRHDDHVFRTERYPAQPAPGKYTAWCGYGVEQEGSHKQPCRVGGVASLWEGLQSERRGHGPAMLCSFCVLCSKVFLPSSAFARVSPSKGWTRKSSLPLINLPFHPIGSKKTLTFASECPAALENPSLRRWRVTTCLAWPGTLTWRGSFSEQPRAPGHLHSCVLLNCPISQSRKLKVRGLPQVTQPATAGARMPENSYFT